MAQIGAGVIEQIITQEPIVEETPVHSKPTWEDLTDNARGASGRRPPIFFGRREILVPDGDATPDNIIGVLKYALPIHDLNSSEIDYLYQYYTGNQPILWCRDKKVRPDIDNRVVENNALSIAQFAASYFLGEPLAYTSKGNGERTSEDVATLNKWMSGCFKASCDKELANWMSICGVAYRMAMPSPDLGEDDSISPIQIDSLDPRNTFVVRNSGFGKPIILAATKVYTDRLDASKFKIVGYTSTHQFTVSETLGNPVFTPHWLPGIPIWEYQLNMARMGSFEMVLSLLDALNNVESNRVDSIEQFVQSFLKFKDCDIEEKDIQMLNQLGAIKITSIDGKDSDVELISSEMNQTQNQTVVDNLYEKSLSITGTPTTTKGGTSTSDTGTAVMLRDGWQQREALAKDQELYFKKSESAFLKFVLLVTRETPMGLSVRLPDIEIKFTRRQYENLASKSSVLLNLLNAGIEPGLAIATSGVFTDPEDAYQRSKEYLGAKWGPGAELAMAGAADETIVVDEVGGDGSNSQAIVGAMPANGG